MKGRERERQEAGMRIERIREGAKTHFKQGLRIVCINGNFRVVYHDINVSVLPSLHRGAREHAVGMT